MKDGSLPGSSTDIRQEDRLHILSCKVDCIICNRRHLYKYPTNTITFQFPPLTVSLIHFFGHKFIIWREKWVICYIKNNANIRTKNTNVNTVDEIMFPTKQGKSKCLTFSKINRKKRNYILKTLRQINILGCITLKVG